MRTLSVPRISQAHSHYRPASRATCRLQAPGTGGPDDRCSGHIFTYVGVAAGQKAQENTVQSYRAWPRCTANPPHMARRLRAAVWRAGSGSSCVHVATTKCRRGRTGPHGSCEARGADLWASHLHQVQTCKPAASAAASGFGPRGGLGAHVHRLGDIPERKGGKEGEKLMRRGRAEHCSVGLQGLGCAVRSRCGSATTPPPCQKSHSPSPHPPTHHPHQQHTCTHPYHQWPPPTPSKPKHPLPPCTHSSSSASFLSALRAMAWKAASTLTSSLAEVSKKGMLPLAPHHCLAFFSDTCRGGRGPEGEWRGGVE